MIGQTKSKKEIVMSLITCPECKKKVSDTADSCPNCGCQFTPEKIAEIKVKEQRVQKGCGIGCLSVIAIFFVLYLIGFFSSDYSGNSSSSSSSSSHKLVENSD